MQIVSNEIDDATLWSEFIKGNQNSLELLYKRHYTLLLNYGLKFTQDRELTKDCIQDVFFKLHKSKDLSYTISPRSYLLKALRNILYDKLSSIKETVDLEEFTFQMSDSQDLFDQLFSRSDEDLLLAKQLLEAITALRSNQKTALYLRYVRDLSYKEIAEIMDINVQSSMNLVSRSLTKLRELLKDDNLILILLFISKAL